MVARASVDGGMHSKEHAFPDTGIVDFIDVPSGAVVTNRSSVKELKKFQGGLIFTRLDEALPYFPEHASSILPWAPILDELNNYSLTVTGLPDGNYESN